MRPRWFQSIIESPIKVRFVPFLLFAILTTFQGYFGDASRYWIYGLKSLAGAGMVWAIYPYVQEMRWKLSWEAIVVGVGVLVMWVGIDPYYPKLGEIMNQWVNPLLKAVGFNPKPGQPVPPWNPHEAFGDQSILAWLCIIVRLLGSTLVVPPLEEVFYRSFVYRYIEKSDFQSVSMGYLALRPLIITSLIFGFTHEQWLAGILCGLIFQGLVIYKQRLSDVIVAHAITNFLLALYVIWKGAWQFW